MGQKQALQHLCLELGLKRCSSELTILIVVFRMRKGHLPRRGRGKEAELEALPAACQKAALSRLVKVKGTRNRYTISAYDIFPKQRTRLGAD